MNSGAHHEDGTLKVTKKDDRSMPRLEYVAGIHPRLHFCRDAALLRLKDGLDRLVCRDNGRARSESYDLYLGGKPLVETYIPGCGTCGTRLSAGYGDGLMNEAACQAVRDAINAGYDGLKPALAYLTPFVGLMASGMYVASDIDLFPVVNGGPVQEHFWDVPDYNSELHFLHCFVGGGTDKLDAPMFLAPTQRASMMDTARVEEYRRRLQEGEHFPRALALYLNGGVALLLDGHHKAAACAAEGVPVRTLVIFRVEEMKSVQTALEEGRRLYLHHAKSLKTSAGPLILRDGAGAELSRMSCLETMARKRVEPEKLEPIPWGHVPDKYVKAGRDRFPNAGRLTAATLIPPDQIRQTIEAEMVKPKGLRDMSAVAHLRCYAELFPDSKWLSASERAWLNRPWIDF